MASEILPTMQQMTRWTVIVFMLATKLAVQPASAGGQEPDSPSAVAFKTSNDVCFYEVDGVKLMADFYRPQIDGLVPIMLVIHGGGWVAGDKWQIAVHAERIAAAGIAVLSINYRLAPEFKYPSQIDDVHQAIRYIVQEQESLQVDPARLGIWGYSAGGHLAALAATRPENQMPRPVVCIAGGAPCDLTIIGDSNTTLVPFLGATPADNRNIYRDASPITFASDDDPPTFFFNGDSDFLVPADNSRRLYEKLKSLGVTTQFLLTKRQGHLATFVNMQAVDAAIEFALAYLMDEHPKNDAELTASGVGE